MDIDRLIRKNTERLKALSFGSLMDIDRLIPEAVFVSEDVVLVL